MPFISTKTNVSVSKEKETQLKERLGQAISIIPGKSENWLMLAIEGDIPMYFRGDDSRLRDHAAVRTGDSAFWERLLQAMDKRHNAHSLEERNQQEVIISEMINKL